MKILVLAAFIVAVSSGRLTPKNNQEEPSQWPWEAGKVYHYDVESHTLAYHTEGPSTGNSFRARLTVRARAPGQLQAKLEQPQNSQVHQDLKRHEPMPQDLKYQPVPNLDKPFEINYNGGRVLSLSLPSSVPLAQENLLKGLVGALQVDLSTYRNVHGSYDTYDKETQQGLFRKMETDVTGDCETLYTASPAAPEWRRELPQFANDEDPIEITKSKNYGHCHHRVDYHFGVPEGAEWTGTAHKARKEQFIQRATVSKILVGKNGPIYRAEATSTVNVHPHLYGKQKAEVHSKVSLQLASFETDSAPEWPKPEGNRVIPNLLYSLSSKQIDLNEDSASNSASNESTEKHIRIDKYSRARRSLKPKSVVAVNKVIVKGMENSGSSSSSESASAYVNDDIPKNNEPAYAALYMNPQPHGDKKQNPMNAQKLVQEIAQQLQNPNNMPKADFLSKFNILVRVISSMSYGQLSQTSRSIEIAKSSNDNIKSDMWMIYRDAVAQAGTSPAFQQIKTWIENKKIEGEEAAEVVAVLVRSLRYPTKETMTQFFELSMTPEVSQQMYLNSTALIAACKFINMGQVNNETSHRYYPSHMYGRLSQKHDRFVEMEILPRLSSELQNAANEGDSHKAQVYIRAIGNLGHRAILNVFAPYLEGKTPASTYLRTRIVESLKVLAYQRDSHVRAVLFSILKNTAEPYEVRVAAIHNIFMCRPTSAMMQAMAQMSNDDPSRQVRAALKSAIVSAAELKNPHYAELAKTAQAARDMVTAEEFGLQYSRKNMNEFPDRDDEYGWMSVLSNIGSKDSLFPKTLKISMKNRFAGWDEESALSIASSNAQKVAEYFLDQLLENSNENRGSESNQKYSAKKISEILNIKKDSNEPLEASLYMDLMNQQRHFAFNEQDIKDFSVQVNKFLSNLNSGISNHYTKVVNRQQVSVMFPVAAGVPFIYKYKEPTVVHIQTSATGKVDFTGRNDPKTEVALNTEVLLTYATNRDGNVGFLDTLSNQHASVGLVQKFQMHIPIKMRLEAKSGQMNFRFEPKEAEQDNTILHYSVWPYTASQKKDTLMTFSQDPSTKVITRPNKVLSFDYKFGQQIGSPFQLQGYSYSKDFRNIGSLLYSKNYISNIIAVLNQRDIAQTHFNLRYLGKQAKSKALSITASYDTLYNQMNAGQWSPVVTTETNDAAVNSPSRRQELVKRVTAGIKAAKVQVVDFGAKFESPEKLEYAFTFAIGRNEVDPKTQFAFYAGRNSDQYGPAQINAVGSLIEPSSISDNFNKALKQEIKITYETDIKYNQKENIHIQGTAERTQKYADELQKLSLATECQQEIQMGNNHQDSCYKAIVMACTPDNFKFTITYKDISPVMKNIASQAYRVAEGLTMWQSEMNPQKANPEGKVDINIDASYLTQTLNLALNSRHGEMRLRNVPIPKSSPSLLSAFGTMQPQERVFNYYSMLQYQPYCSVDENKVRTFSDRSYNYKLTKSWHVVLHDERPDGNEDLVVLARRPNENMQEMYISYRSHTGKELEIEVQPAPQGQKQHAVKVNTNARKVREGEVTMYWDDVDEIPLLEYHTEADGVLKLNIRENRLRVVYDGSRVVVMANQKRWNVRGICGYMSGEPRDDYLTPNGLIDEPKYYAASYVLIDESSEPNERELQTQAKQMAYEPRKKHTAILRSDEKWQQNMRLASEEEWGSQIIYRARNYLKTKGPCKLMPQVQFYENHGEICITTTELPACQSHCVGQDYKVQAANVVCRPKTDLQFRTYRDQIRMGQNPNVNGVPQIAQYRVPGTCNA